MTRKLSYERYIWFHNKVNQEMTKRSDGSLILEVPATDLTEIKYEILRFSAGAEVLKPENLRKEIEKEAEKIKELYN